MFHIRGRSRLRVMPSVKRPGGRARAARQARRRLASVLPVPMLYGPLISRAQEKGNHNMGAVSPVKSVTRQTYACLRGLTIVTIPGVPRLCWSVFMFQVQELGCFFRGSVSILISRNIKVAIYPMQCSSMEGFKDVCNLRVIWVEARLYMLRS